MIRRALARVRSIGGLAFAQLRHYRGRALLAALGVAFGVLLIVLLVGLSQGVTDAGTSALEWIDRDLWMTGGVQLAPGTIGGIQNQLYDAHETTRDIAAREEVKSAGALAFQTVYAKTNGSEFTTLVGVGTYSTGNASKFNVQQGSQFSTGDVHYANGTYEGPWSGEVIIDERTATVLNVSVGDTIHVGGTLVSAREHTFEVVGISPTFSTFLGTATVTLHLSELQDLTGKTANDPASIVAITLEQGVDATEMEAALERDYPYEVRTNREQFRAFVGDNGGVLAGVFTLAIVAVVSGVLLVVNVLATLVQHQRREFAALRATGVSSRTLVGLVVGQGLWIGFAGALLGVGGAPVASRVLNGVVSDLTGFNHLIRTPAWLLAGSASLAFLVAISGAAVAAWRVARTPPLRYLRHE